MDLMGVYVKTPLGCLEIETRRNKLGREYRFFLVMVDGTTTAEELLQQAASIGGTAAMLDELLRSGYIALEPSSVPAQAAGVPDAPAVPPGAGTAEPIADAVPAPSAESRFLETRQLMTDSVVNAMGLRSFTFTLKLERACSIEDLKKLFPDYAKLIGKGSGKLETEVLVSKVKELLG
jgi:hypothetical protein